MRQSEGNNEEVARGTLSKYLNRSIEIHESNPKPTRFEDEKRNSVTNGLFNNLPSIGSVNFFQNSQDKAEKEK